MHNMLIFYNEFKGCMEFIGAQEKETKGGS